MALPEQSDPRTDRPVTVAIADDDPRVRQALARLVATDPRFAVVATAADAEEAVAAALAHQVDIAVVDVQMPRGTGLRVVRELSVLAPSIRVLALSGYGDRKYVIQMLDAGAVGYMVKSAELDLLGALHAVVRGERVLSHEVTGHVIAELSHSHFGAPRIGAGRIAEVLDARSFSVAFQPIFSLRNRTAVGVEALARLSPDPALPPDVWFAEAWAVGLGPDLELALVQRAIERSRRRPVGTFLSVNVSPEVAVDRSFAALVTRHGRPHDLVLELTEHTPVQDYDGLMARLDHLRRHGVRIAVDDVGAGYANFRHVLRLRPDIVKMDVSLTTEIDSDPSCRALAAGLVAVGNELRATVVAEGIETRSQLESLVALGVEHGQGYYLARPGRLEDAVRQDAALS